MKKIEFLIFKASGPLNISALYGIGENFVFQNPSAGFEFFNTCRAMIASGFSDDKLTVFYELPFLNIGQSRFDANDAIPIFGDIQSTGDHLRLIGVFLLCSCGYIRNIGTTPQGGKGKEYDWESN